VLKYYIIIFDKTVCRRGFLIQWKRYSNNTFPTRINISTPCLDVLLCLCMPSALNLPLLVLYMIGYKCRAEAMIVNYVTGTSF